MRERSVGCGIGVYVAAAVIVAGPAAAAPTEPGSLVNGLQETAECVKCHAFGNPQELAGEPYIMPAAWQASMMGNSARDPVFWAGVAISHQDDPGGTELCVRCHVPRAFVDQRGGVIALEELEPADLSGVDCELCHRLLADDATPAGDALYQIDDVLGLDGDVPKRGPWDYAGGSVPNHGYLADAYIGTSRACGTCHDVTTSQMRVDARGAPLGVAFGEQRTYSEWEGSAYAVAGPEFKGCVDCHMPAVANVAGCAKFNTEGETHPTGGRRHDLAGANRRMVELLKQVYGDAGESVIDDVFFDIAIDNIDRTLATAATLEVTAPAMVDVTQGISGWTVKVTNNTGHKLPTGYSEGRVMWLEVIARHGEEVVYGSGRWVDGEGLADDPQLRTYEGRAIELASKARFHLLRNDHWEVDSRIPPKGLKANLQTDPVGDRYALLPDQTWPNYDEVSYEFPAAQVLDATADEADEMTLSVRLLYVINTPEYVDFLADENKTNEAGQTVADLFAGLAPAPLELASWTQTVPLTGLTPVEAGSSSGPGSSEGGESGPTPTTGVTSSGPGTTGVGPMDSTGTTGVTSTSSTSSTSSTGEQEGGGGCGCRSAGGLGLMWLPLLLLRRRRAQVS